LLRNKIPRNCFCTLLSLSKCLVWILWWFSTAHIQLLFTCVSSNIKDMSRDSSGCTKEARGTPAFLWFKNSLNHQCTMVGWFLRGWLRNTYQLLAPLVLIQDEPFTWLYLLYITEHCVLDIYNDKQDIQWAWFTNAASIVYQANYVRRSALSKKLLLLKEKCMILIWLFKHPILKIASKMNSDPKLVTWLFCYYYYTLNNAPKPHFVEVAITF